MEHSRAGKHQSLSQKEDLGWVAMLGAASRVSGGISARNESSNLYLALEAVRELRRSRYCYSRGITT
jgi:hypothetical protein